MNPMRDVTKARWESGARASRGVIVGTIVTWTLTLSCGHEVKRVDKTKKLTKPKKARCRACGDGAVRVEFNGEAP